MALHGPVVSTEVIADAAAGISRSMLYKVAAFLELWQKTRQPSKTPGSFA